MDRRGTDVDRRGQTWVPAEQGGSCRPILTDAGWEREGRLQAVAADVGALRSHGAWWQEGRLFLPVTNTTRKNRLRQAFSRMRVSVRTWKRFGKATRWPWLPPLGRRVH